MYKLSVSVVSRYYSRFCCRCRVEMGFVSVFPNEVTDPDGFLLVKNTTEYNALSFTEKAFVVIRRHNGIMFEKTFVTPKMMDGLERCLKLAQVCGDLTGSKNISWKLAQKRLNNPSRISNYGIKSSSVNCSRSNSDVRFGFAFENVLLVKTYFTFGMQKPEADEVHVVQTTNVPMLIYLPKEDYARGLANKY